MSLFQLIAVRPAAPERLGRPRTFAGDPEDVETHVLLEPDFGIRPLVGRSVYSMGSSENRRVSGSALLNVGPRAGCGQCPEEEMVDMIRSLAGRAYLALSNLREREEGQAMVEYALILFLVSVVSIAILTTLGTKVSSVFNQVVDDI
jgi:pilus assembly protein Flp/PilA